MAIRLLAGILCLAALLDACSSRPDSSGIPGPCSSPADCLAKHTWNFALGPRPVPTAGKLDVHGKLVFPRKNTLSALDLQTRATSTVVELAKNTSLSTPALAPDGEHVALTVYTPSTDPKDLGGADLYIVDLADGSSRVLVNHGDSGVWLSDPSWSEDGQTIYFTRRAAMMENGKYQGEKVSVERVNADGSDPNTMVEDASSPSVSADGRYLAYLSPVGGTERASLWVATFDGQPPRKVADGSSFSQLGTPRFSPRGSQLAFTGVGGPPNTPVGEPLSPPSARGGPPATLHDAWAALRSFASPSLAEAHGIPWDLWMVQPDGSGLTRLTDLGEDGPVPTWSPDGSSIALSGEIGLYLVDLTTWATTLVAPQPAAGLVWISPR